MTRTDFDGVVADGLLIKRDMISDEILFAEPRDMQQGKIVVADLRGGETIYACNCFLIYGLFPAAQVSIHAKGVVFFGCFEGSIYSFFSGF